MSLSIWQATELESVKSSGRTCPLVMWCVPSEDSSAEPKRFVIKSPGQPEVFEANLFAEVVGNLVAIEFGVITPRPALVFLSDKLVQNIQPQLPNNIKLRGGMGAGCEYLPELKPLLSDMKFTTDLHSQAALIYSLDLFLANPDRRIGKPNCGLLQDSLLAYDFECCFSFVFSLPAFSPKPWELSKLGIAKHHIFHQELVARGAQWSPFMDKMEQLDERRLRELVKDLPASWMSNASRVFDHLLQAQEQPQKLILELESSLHL